MKTTEKMSIKTALKNKKIHFDGMTHCYRIKHLNDTVGMLETMLLAKKKEELEKSWYHYCDAAGQQNPCSILDITQEKGKIFHFLVEDNDDEDYGYMALSFSIHVFRDADYSKTDVMQMITNASRKYVNGKKGKKPSNFTYADFECYVPNKICKRYGFEKIPCTVKDFSALDEEDYISLDWNSSPLETGMKTLYVTVQCLATYNSSIQVPANMSREEAIQYAKAHINEINVGELEYVSDSDELDEENCDLAFERP